MNWTAALERLKAGAVMRRRSEMGYELEWIDGAEVRVSSGVEACRVMRAWEVGAKPVDVFIGWPSRCFFVPDEEDVEACDWVEVDARDIESVVTN